MKTYSEDGLWKIYQSEFHPFAYITQNREYSGCPFETIDKNLLNIDFLKRRKVYLAITHPVVIKRLKRIANLKVICSLPTMKRDISVHKKRLFSKCAACEEKCRKYKLLGGKKTMQLKDILQFLFEQNE